MKYPVRAPSPFETLLADLEKAAGTIPRATADESEALFAELAGRLARFDRSKPVPDSQAKRASRVLAALSASVCVLRAGNEARLSALLNAAHPPAGYNGAGRFSTEFTSGVRSAA
jgi:hypothetical protein